MRFQPPNQAAPELRVGQWIDAEGSPMADPVRLADLGPGYKVIFCFQHWCPGCHSSGFPTMQFLYNNLKNSGVGFAVIQTVFEGAEANTSDKLRENQSKYELPVPFGHDVPADGANLPSFMQDYQTGGTPWFTVIDPASTVVYRGFRFDAETFVRAVKNGVASDQG